MKRTAAVLLALLTIAGPAQAFHTVSLKVGPLLQQAQALIAARNYQAAAAKLNEAEAVKVTADDAYVIDQFKNAIVASLSDPPPTLTPIITPQFPQP
jgi:hypothetical protein